MPRRPWAWATVGAVGWLAGLGSFLAYVNWFSETGRSGGSLVLTAGWLCVLVGVVATVALLLTGTRAIVRRPGPHA